MSTALLATMWLDLTIAFPRVDEPERAGSNDVGAARCWRSTMTRFAAAAALPVLALLGACGGQEITTTNDSNVVSNDVYANAAFRNDGEVGNEMIAINPMETEANSVTTAGDAMMGNTPDAMNATMGNSAN